MPEPPQGSPEAYGCKRRSRTYLVIANAAAIDPCHGADVISRRSGSFAMHVTLHPKSGTGIDCAPMKMIEAPVSAASRSIAVSASAGSVHALESATSSGTLKVPYSKPLGTIGVRSVRPASHMPASLPPLVITTVVLG